MNKLWIDYYLGSQAPEDNQYPDGWECGWTADMIVALKRMCRRVDGLY